MWCKVSFPNVGTLLPPFFKQEPKLHKNPNLNFNQQNKQKIECAEDMKPMKLAEKNWEKRGIYFACEEFW